MLQSAGFPSLRGTRGQSYRAGELNRWEAVRPSLPVWVSRYRYCVALISSSLGAGAMVQARMSCCKKFSVTLTDTGPLSAEAQDVCQENIVLILPSQVTGRDLRDALTDRTASHM